MCDLWLIWFGVKSDFELLLKLLQMASSTLICDTEQWKDLKVLVLIIEVYKESGIWLSCETCISVQAHVDDIKKTHLRELMSDTERCNSMMVYDTLLNLLKSSCSYLFFRWISPLWSVISIELYILHCNPNI